MDYRGRWSALLGIVFAAFFAVTPAHAAAAQGAWLVGGTGRTAALSAPALAGGDADHPIVAAAGTPTGDGLWLLGADGAVVSRGAAPSFGPVPRGTAKAVGIVSSPDGAGYLVAFADGSVRAAGDAVAFGSATGNVVAIAATPTGDGYWLVGSDGTVSAFGDAPALGPASVLGRVVAAASTPTGRGLWLADVDGNVAALGDATPLPGAGRLHGPVTAIAATPSGAGLWLVTGNGTVESRGDASAFTSDAHVGKVVAIVSSTPTGRLTVHVSDLPAGAAAAVRATGAGVSFSVVAAETLRVPAGDYVVSGDAVHVDTLRYLPTITGSPATVAAGGTAAATAEYATALPDTTKVLDSSSIADATGTPLSGLTLTLDTATSPPLAVGDVVVAGVTSATPYGVLGKVTSVTVDGSTETVQTTPAELTDAIARGQIDLDSSLTQTGSPKRVRRLQSRRDLSLSEIRQTIAENLDCGGGTPVSLDADAGITPTLHFHVKWGWTHLNVIDSASFTVGAQQSASLKFTAGAAAHCSLSVPIGSPITVKLTGDIGIPVVVVVQIQFKLNVSGSVDAGVATSVGETWEPQVGVQYADGGVNPIADPGNPSFTFEPPAPTADASIAASVGPDVSMLAYGVEGIGFNIDGGLEADADLAALPPDPWWSLYATLNAGGGVVGDLFTWTNPEMYSRKYLLASGVRPPRENLIVAKPGAVRPGQSFTVTGSGFDANEDVTISVAGSAVGTTTTDDSGHFSTKVAASDPGRNARVSVVARGAHGDSGSTSILLAWIPKYEWVPDLRIINLATTPLDLGWVIGSKDNTQWIHLDGSSLGTIPNGVPAARLAYTPASAYWGYPAGWIFQVYIGGNNWDSVWAGGNWGCGSRWEDPAWQKMFESIGGPYITIALKNGFEGCIPNVGGDATAYELMIPADDMPAALVAADAVPWTGQPYSVLSGWANKDTGAGLTSDAPPYPSASG